MSTYLVTFKPMEPYFFGNEKNFAYSKNDKNPVSNSYFIKSEYVPSQSTILGALRYILLPVKKSNWDYTADEKKKNAEAVGANSFNPSDERNEFGKIKKISPVFLYDGVNDLVPTPFDHIDGNRNYTPFTFEENDKVDTLDGEYLYTEKYNAKDGITSAYLNLTDGAIVELENIFISVTRMGINRSDTENGMFKKRYVQLADEYSFAVYLELDDEKKPENAIVHLGQGKSTFVVTFEPKENDIEGKIAEHLSDEIIYFFGDAFVSNDIYKKCKFAATKTKTYRAFQKQGKTVNKDSKLYNLISAGSIVIPKDKSDFIKFVKNDKVQSIGYNTIITK